MHKVSYASLEAGQRFVGPGRTLTETDHGIFMMLVGDWGALHSDAEYAKTTRFGQRLMHGGFGVALALGMQAHLLDFDEPVIGALELKDWTFEIRCSSATPFTPRSRSWASGSPARATDISSNGKSGW